MNVQPCGRLSFDYLLNMTAEKREKGVFYFDALDVSSSFKLSYKKVNYILLHQFACRKFCKLKIFLAHEVKQISELRCNL